jgi:hypothetical protein
MHDPNTSAREKQSETWQPHDTFNDPSIDLSIHPSIHLKETFLEQHNQNEHWPRDRWSNFQGTKPALHSMGGFFRICDHYNGKRCVGGTFYKCDSNDIMNLLEDDLHTITYAHDVWFIFRHFYRKMLKETPIQMLDGLCFVPLSPLPLRELSFW